MADRRTAIITGASQGIGAETAREFGRRGYAVTVTARTRDKLESVADDIRASGGEALVHAGDLCDLEFAESAIDATIKEFDRIDVLVNNAAWRDIVTMRNITKESWERTLRIALTTPAFMARWAAVQMEKQGSGVIINISSTMSERAGGMSPAYETCKGGLNSLTYELSALYGPTGIRVVGVNPGAIDTEMSNDYTNDENTAEIHSTMCGMTPLRRLGQPVEIARTIAWVASDEASFITGTCIVADGGIQTQLHPLSVQHLMFPDEFHR